MRISANNKRNYKTTTTNKKIKIRKWISKIAVSRFWVEMCLIVVKILSIYKNKDPKIGFLSQFFSFDFWGEMWIWICHTAWYKPLFYIFITHSSLDDNWPATEHHNHNAVISKNRHSTDIIFTQITCHSFVSTRPGWAGWNISTVLH